MSSTKGHVYICQFDNGMVKVGRSARNPQARIDSHAKRMSCTGSKMIDNYISPILNYHEEVEEELMSIIENHLTSDSREWASGITKEEILSKANLVIDEFEVRQDWHGLYETIDINDRDGFLRSTYKNLRPFSRSLALSAMPDISKIEPYQEKAVMLLAISIENNIGSKYYQDEYVIGLLNLSNDPYDDNFYAEYLESIVGSFYNICAAEVERCQKDG